MRRREFIAGLGGAAAWPLVARAQKPALPIIGFLVSSSEEQTGDLLVPFRQGLADGGYVDGQNVTIDFRWADNQMDRLPALALDLAPQRSGNRHGWRWCTRTRRQGGDVNHPNRVYER